jgi:hypothetical protein
MDISGLFSKIIAVPKAAGAKAAALFTEKLGPLAQKLPRFSSRPTEGPLFRLREFWIKWRKWLLLGVGGAAALGVLLGLLFAAGERRSVRRDARTGISEAFSPLPLQAEDLFLAEEPDFVPPYLLERDLRAEDDLTDLLPFWTDPLREDEWLWRNRFSREVDKLSETLP